MTKCNFPITCPCDISKGLKIENRLQIKIVYAYCCPLFHCYSILRNQLLFGPTGE